MRILHLSHSDLQGGAARAAERLVRGLRLLGADARFLVKNKISDDPRTLQAIPAGGPEAASLEEQATLVRKYCVERHRTPLSNSLFSLPVPACAVAAHEEISLADVVNLHWISGLVSPAEIGRVQALGKPVVWTLHDQRAFTGGCHYSAGCRNFAQLCRNCPQLEDDDLGLAPAALQESISQIRPSIAVVSPSRWLADFAAQSALFRQARVTVIPYGLDTEVFQPGRAEARRRLQWDDGAVYLLFGADNFAETRKGFDLFAPPSAPAFSAPTSRKRRRGQENQFRLLWQLPTTFPPSISPPRWLGRFDSDATLARIYAASDAFILPTREDNLPNTMLESTCCGTPVIGFRYRRAA
jgi:glycosyltransferase involved in cell wall biosynthesis